MISAKAQKLLDEMKFRYYEAVDPENGEAIQCYSTTFMAAVVLSLKQAEDPHLVEMLIMKLEVAKRSVEVDIDRRIAEARELLNPELVK